MSFDWRKALRALMAGLAILVFFGGALLVAFVFGSLGAFPLYVTRAIPLFGIPAVIALMVWASGYLRPWGKRLLAWVMAAVTVITVGYIGWGAYTDAIPTVDDRSLLLRDYEPFRADNKLVTLGEPADFQITNPYALRIDGATALYPVYAAFTQAVYPEGEYPRHDSAVTCCGTIEAYERLINGEVNVIFAAAPSQDQLQTAAERGVELHLTPVGKEAFVFFVNAKNPVTGLTVEQVRGIYAGEITNWRQVGGKNQSIRPFQRMENSGSQSALERLMGDTPIMEPEEEDRIADMGGIIRQVASYRNYQNAIGFSFRYYATEMVRNGDIRLLALDGVEPTRETIRSGEYPIASHFYAVTASRQGQPAPETENETLAGFLDWVRSPQGQRIVEETGYVALS